MRSFWGGSLLLFVACVGDSGTDAGITGDLGGPCFSDFTCKTGLVCDKGPNKCVQPDASTIDAPISDGTTQDNQTVDVVTTDGGACATTGLVAWWKAESNGNDEMGNFNLTGPGNAFGTGLFGMGFLLDGSSAFFESGSGSNASFVNLPSFTIEGWVKIADVSGMRVIFSRRADGSASGPLFALNGSHLFYQVGNGNVSGQTTFVVSNIFRHVAVVYDGSNVKFYVDGQPDGSDHPLSGTVPSDGVTLRVGAKLGPAVGAYSPFAGTIDDLAFYSKALSPTDIQMIATGAGNFVKCH